jgi:hypothetical protein
MTSVVQIKKGGARSVALVEGSYLRLLAGARSVYDLAHIAEASGRSLVKIIHDRAGGDRLDYDAVYTGKSNWKLLPPIHHPVDPARCLVSGTGLTHLGSAKNRQAMHSASQVELNDSMKMFRWGVEGGKPVPGKIGIPPEWFYKGNGASLRACGESLDVPPYAEDGGEEAEVAGVYLIGDDGTPRRVGLAIGNEFSDHKFEKKNYLNLAGSKLRTCSLGPELVIDPQFDSVPGKVAIIRTGTVLWSQDILTGENEMCHSLSNLEHHHFKFEGHRRPGDVHVHYFGACSLSFGAGIELADGDIMEVSFNGFGRALRNSLRILRDNPQSITVKPLS